MPLNHGKRETWKKTISPSGAGLAPGKLLDSEGRCADRGQVIRRITRADRCLPEKEKGRSPMRRCDRPNADGGVDEELAAVCPPGVSPVATIGLAGVTAAFRPRCWFTGPSGSHRPSACEGSPGGGRTAQGTIDPCTGSGSGSWIRRSSIAALGDAPARTTGAAAVFFIPAAFVFPGKRIRRRDLSSLLYGFPQRALAGNNRGDMTRLMPGLPRGVGIRMSMPAARPIASGCPARRQAVLRRWLGIQWNSKDPTKITSKTPPGHFGVKATSPQMSPPRPGSPVATT
ncbi:hypothetical protein EDC25_11361 [Pseudofulvimonas gallinarii]|uniref:Uncharacterized protein n=1 Tax=Pseudofulvimonas gallinarii TaxID=634155 RepID=A0A4R3LDG1_9GAMM|nr:hypothetical protein EDC25_11361 [Pseudofulvimonas gallinarii]